MNLVLTSVLLAVCTILVTGNSIYQVNNGDTRLPERKVLIKINACKLRRQIAGLKYERILFGPGSIPDLHRIYTNQMKLYGHLEKASQYMEMEMTIKKARSEPVLGTLTSDHKKLLLIMEEFWDAVVPPNSKYVVPKRLKPLTEEQLNNTIRSIYGRLQRTIGKLPNTLNNFWINLKTVYKNLRRIEGAEITMEAKINLSKAIQEINAAILLRNQISMMMPQRQLLKPKLEDSAKLNQLNLMGQQKPSQTKFEDSVKQDQFNLMGSNISTELSTIHECQNQIKLQCEATPKELSVITQTRSLIDQLRNSVVDRKYLLNEQRILNLEFLLAHLLAHSPKISH